MLKEGFWNDNESSQKLLKERSRINDAIKSSDDLRAKLDELELMLELTEEESEDKSLLEGIQKSLRNLRKEVQQEEYKTVLSGEHDISNAIVSFHPGAGGTESQDWAEMLFRMYLRWAEDRGFKRDIIDYQPGDEAGIKSVTCLISGDYAYGYLKGESGVHRLVRISPFDAGGRRHTSFVSVFVIPEIDDDIEVEIKESDLKIDTYRSSGAGGQHVNVTDSAVRITHLPTGIVVQCQNERSQHKNKAMALKVLRSRLYDYEERRQREKIDEMHREKKEIAWGSQIRSYILHPYRIIKDHRTGIEVGDVDAVLDGNINQFIESYLFQYRKK
jgi:peptide chain release factor 2